VTLELQACSRTGDDVACEIVITTQDEEARFFQRTSKAVGPNGEILKWMGYQDPGQKLERGDITRSYKPGVKNKASVFYKGPALEGLFLSVVEVKYGRETYTFTNVPVK
jgi:hypothetical protein